MLRVEQLRRLRWGDPCPRPRLRQLCVHRAHAHSPPHRPAWQPEPGQEWPPPGHRTKVSYGHQGISTDAENGQSALPSRWPISPEWIWGDRLWAPNRGVSAHAKPRRAACTRLTWSDAKAQRPALPGWRDRLLDLVTGLRVLLNPELWRRESGTRV